MSTLKFALYIKRIPTTRRTTCWRQLASWSRADAAGHAGVAASTFEATRAQDQRAEPRPAGHAVLSKITSGSHGAMRKPKRSRRLNRLVLRVEGHLLLISLPHPVSWPLLLVLLLLTAARASTLGRHRRQSPARRSWVQGHKGNTTQRQHCCSLRQCSPTCKRAMEKLRNVQQRPQLVVCMTKHPPSLPPKRPKY